ncbi:MAG: hypothetical protein HY062_14350 [Bacteroidetes bacterium]|nr:hypothetical protein [Bacteroidota bacterium]
MAEKNNFIDFKSDYDSTDWNNYIPLNTYQFKQVHELPDFIQQNGLSKKFNSALVVASASTSYDFYGVIGYRPDEKNKVIDEHAFVYIRDKGTDEIFGGILHHGDYEGRTTAIPEHIKNALDASGVTASISFSRMPSSNNGDLDKLMEDGILSGVSANFNISFDKIKKDGK